MSGPPRVIMAQPFATADHWLQSVGTLDASLASGSLKPFHMALPGERVLENNGSRFLWVSNGLLLLALLAFFAAVFFDVRIQMSSLSVMTFGLIFFPIAFVIINMRALNRRYPLGGRRHEDDTTARRGGGE